MGTPPSEEGWTEQVLRPASGNAGCPAAGPPGAEQLAWEASGWGLRAGCSKAVTGRCEEKGPAGCPEARLPSPGLFSGCLLLGRPAIPDGQPEPPSPEPSPRRGRARGSALPPTWRDVLAPLEGQGRDLSCKPPGSLDEQPWHRKQGHSKQDSSFSRTAGAGSPPESWSSEKKAAWPLLPPCPPPPPSSPAPSPIHRLQAPRPECRRPTQGVSASMGPSWQQRGASPSGTHGMRCCQPSPNALRVPDIKPASP